MFGGRSVRVSKDGAFTPSGINPDQYDLDTFGLPDGYYFKSVRVGQHLCSQKRVRLHNGMRQEGAWYRGYR